ncbi:MAG: peptidase [Thaumarchaeota archaeon]|nr:MAG: peptidase [Nitrososphaerota archaeon]TLX90536.1 MAG: peptidase [Nitrososphaerota archaeon]
MFFRKKKETNDVVRRKIILTRQITNSVITYAKSWHPNEGILILQGKKEKNLVKITGLIIPPFSTHGPYYSGFPVYELPFDLSYIGTIHSHPSGSNNPSLEDLNHFFGLVSLIICYPYDAEDIAAFDRNGNKMDLETG